METTRCVICLIELSNVILKIVMFPDNVNQVLGDFKDIYPSGLTNELTPLS